MKEKKGKVDEFARLKEGKDYYVDSLDRFVFTREFLVHRGYCCKSGCRHCPYGYKKSRLLDL